MRKRPGRKGRSIADLALIILKMSAASGMAWELAKLAGSKHPFLAPLSVILCVQTTVLQSIRYSFHRIVGTVFGAVLTVCVAERLSINGWTLALMLALVSGAALLLERKEAVIHEVALSVLLVFALQKQSGHYGLDRIRDTAIGLAAGLAVHTLVYPPNLTKQAERTIFTLQGSLADWCALAAAWMEGGCSQDLRVALRTEAHTFQQELFQAEKQMEKAAESLTFNLFARSRRLQLQRDRNRISLMKRGAAYLERTAEVMAEWSTSGTLPDGEHSRWAERLVKIGLFWRDQSQSQGSPYVPIPDVGPVPFANNVPLRCSAILYAETSELLQELARSP